MLSTAELTSFSAALRLQSRLCPVGQLSAGGGGGMAAPCAACHGWHAHAISSGNDRSSRRDADGGT